MRWCMKWKLNQTFQGYVNNFSSAVIVEVSKSAMEFKKSLPNAFISESILIKIYYEYANIEGHKMPLLCLF